MELRHRDVGDSPGPARPWGKAWWGAGACTHTGEQERQTLTRRRRTAPATSLPYAAARGRRMPSRRARRSPPMHRRGDGHSCQRQAPRGRVRRVKLVYGHPRVAPARAKCQHRCVIGVQDAEVGDHHPAQYFKLRVRQGRGHAHQRPAAKLSMRYYE